MKRETLRRSDDIISPACSSRPHDCPGNRIDKRRMRGQGGGLLNPPFFFPASRGCSERTIGSRSARETSRFRFRFLWKAQAQMRERWSRLDKARASMLACPLCGTRAISGREEGNAFPGSAANLQIRRRQRATCVTYIEFPTILGDDNRPVSIYAI